MIQNIRAMPEEEGEFQSPPTGADAPRRENPLWMLHRILAGRYHWAVILGVILGALAGFAAHTVVKNKYSSVGIIQITPVTRGFLNDRTTIMPMFNSYMDTQVSLIQSSRTIQLAMDSEEWKKAIQTVGPRSLGNFMDSLKVEHEHDGEQINITYTDPAPIVAAAGVRSIIAAYQRVSEETQVGIEAPRTLAMEAQQKDLSEQLDRDNKIIMGIAASYGTDDLKSIFDAQLVLCNNLRTALKEKQMLLTVQQAGSADETPATGPAATSSAPTAPPTPEIVAVSNTQMRALLDQRNALQSEIDSLRLTLAEGHPTVQKGMAQLRATESAITKLMQPYLAAATQPGERLLPLAAPGNNSGMMSKAQLQRLVDMLQAQYDAAMKESIEIGNKELQIRTIKTKDVTLRERLESIKSQLNEDDLQRVIGGRLSVLTTGEVPFRPDKDKNRQMTMVGGAGGMILGVALIGLLGFFDRRLKSVNDAQRFLDRSNRVLGILPALPDDFKDPEQAAMAAYCVHHIRTLLQLGEGLPSHPVIAVTSAGPGDGKTSLVLSLGHSYAATGARTLVIDFDFIGEGLTTRAGAVIRRKIGEILIREGYLQRDRLAEGLARAAKSGKRLGETLVEMGLITEPDLERALLKQRKSTLGLLDVLEGEPLANCLAQAAPNLSLLAVGDVGSKRQGHLSLLEAKRILQEARQNFDVVLVDTGPVLGSLEACVITAVADEVILVVARGQQGPLIDRAVSRLTEIGAKIAGIVFNRAAQKDVEHSVYTSYRRSMRLPVPEGQTREDQTRMLGPVARAVVDADVIADLPAREE